MMFEISRNISASVLAITLIILHSKVKKPHQMVSVGEKDEMRRALVGFISLLDLSDILLSTSVSLGLLYASLKYAQ